MPAEMMSLAQDKHGESVVYRVEPSVEIPVRAAYAIAFDSACNVRVQGSSILQMEGEQCGDPAGAPLYPMEMTRPSLTMRAPTCSLSQVLRLATVFTISMNI